MKTVALVLGFGLLAMPAQAEELSPWFGGEGTPAFQVAAGATDPVVVADALPTGSTSCELSDCPVPSNLAMGAPRAEAP